MRCCPSFSFLVVDWCLVVRFIFRCLCKVLQGALFFLVRSRKSYSSAIDFLNPEKKQCIVYYFVSFELILALFLSKPVKNPVSILMIEIYLLQTSFNGGRRRKFWGLGMLESNFSFRKHSFRKGFRCRKHPQNLKNFRPSAGFFLFTPPVSSWPVSSETPTGDRRVGRRCGT